MKKLLVMLLLLCSIGISAQDVIVKKDGSTIVCRVVDLTDSEIIYKKWSDLNGSNYVMERSAASAINYQDGMKVDFSKATNLYKPNNQNDGVQRYNDRVLLRLDKERVDPYKNVNKKRTIGWIGGVALAGAAVGLYLIYDGSKIRYKAVEDYTYEKEWALPLSVICAGGAVAWTTVFLINANKEKKLIDSNLSSSPVFQYDFNFSNGSFLSAGIDMLSDHSIGKNTLGLGLRYSF